MSHMTVKQYEQLLDARMDPFKMVLRAAIREFHNRLDFERHMAKSAPNWDMRPPRLIKIRLLKELHAKHQAEWVKRIGAVLDQHTASADLSLLSFLSELADLRADVEPRDEQQSVAA